ncbi:hypothetical protein CEE45_06920 [Candidatus Heimdallarchaeota archaeon B3_Heim]|nr:MAG: hypothetical protein CEE45_06920 [Candidatus Heimdallarchaeota archaeon B3_Heim]
MFLPNILSFRACVGQYSGYYIGDSSGLQSYSGGDGLDEEALAWNNIAFQDLYYSVQSRWGQTSGPEHETFLGKSNSELNNIVIAIIDTGISPKMWGKIEDETGCEIELYIKFTPVEAGGNTCENSTVIYDNETLNDNLDNLNIELDITKHGSSVAWALAQAAPGVKFWILDTYPFNAYNAKKSTVMEGALAWLVDHYQDHSELDIVSMSFRIDNDELYFESNRDDIETYINFLKSEGVICLAASGNYDDSNEDDHEDMMVYPRSYTNVWGIGAHFDDADKILENSNAMNYSGQRVSFSLMNEWGSMYNSSPAPKNCFSSVEFVAPGYDYETRDHNYNPIVVDGTSYACPHVAAIVAYAVATCDYARDKTKSNDYNDILHNLWRAAEEINETTVPECSPNSPFPSNPPKYEEIGYGTIDAYDGVKFLLGGEIDHQYTSVAHYTNNTVSSSTKVKIFLEDYYTLRVDYKINAGAWQYDVTQTDPYSVGEEDINLTIANLNAGDSIQIRWTIISDSTDNVINQEDTLTYHEIPGGGGGGGGGGCVAKWTRISLAEGYQWKFVQNLQLGDWVLGYNLTSGTDVPVQVTEIESSTVSSLLIIVHDYGLLRVTPVNQPIYMRNETYCGWLINPQDLKVGDEIFHVPTHSWVHIWHLYTMSGIFEVYDIVTTPLNVFVGNGILLDKKEW